MGQFWDDEVPSYEQIGPIRRWNTAFLGGLQVPGGVEIKGKTGRKIDVKPAPGTDGATVTDQGFDPAKPVLNVTLWTPLQYRTWLQLMAQYNPRPGKSAQKPTAPITLDHDPSNDLGINVVMITGVSILEDGPVVGTKVGTIEMVQWVKPKKANTVTPDAALPSETDNNQYSGNSSASTPTAPDKTGNHP